MPPKKRPRLSPKAVLSAAEALREIQADDESGDDDFSDMEVSEEEPEEEITTGPGQSTENTGNPVNDEVNVGASTSRASDGNSQHDISDDENDDDENLHQLRQRLRQQAQQRQPMIFPDMDDDDDVNSDGEDGDDENGDDEENAPRNWVPVPRQAQPQQPDVADTAYIDPLWLRAFQERCGPMIHDEEATAWEIFSDMLPAEAIRILTNETNRYADQYFQRIGGKENLSKGARAKRWTAVDEADIRAFLGIVLYMGYLKLPTYEEYWSTDWITVLGVRQVMSRDKFLLILSFLHCADNEAMPGRDAQNYDRLYKIRGLQDIFVDAWKSCYKLGREVSIDETIIAFKGRVVFKQYNPAKPHKWGINVWSVAEPQTGYVYNWDVYTGKPTTPDPRTLRNDHRGSIHWTVMDALVNADLLDKGHHIYMDNYFSSATLFNDLADRNTGACGTLRKNRYGTLQSIKVARPKKGDPGVFARDDKVLFATWMDRNLVTVASMVHNDESFIKSTKQGDGHVDRSKPKMVEMYTRHMRGVDLGDQQMWYSLISHRSCKWWKKLLFGMLEVSFCNTLIVLRQLYPNRRHDRNKVRKSLMKELFRGYRRGQSSQFIGPQPQTEQRLSYGVNGHQLEFVSQKSVAGNLLKPDCVVCSSRAEGKRRHQTTTQCKDCKVPLCPVPCAWRYHNLDNYKIDCYKGLHSPSAQ